MTTIVVNGIPGMSKTGLVKDVRDRYNSYFNGNVGSISLGSAFASTAQETYFIDPKDASSLDYSIKQALAPYAVRRFLDQLEDKDFKGKPLIIDTPVTMYAEEGAVPNVVRHASDFIRLDEKRTIDAVVTLIDDPETVAKELADTTYPTDINIILDWMGFEAETTKSHIITLSDLTRKLGEKYVKHLVIPSENADITLLKLLYDYENKRQSTVIYAARPITDLKDKSKDSDEIRAKKEEARNRLDEFAEYLQNFGIVISPIVMADISAAEPLTQEQKEEQKKKQRMHTKHRDLNYFVPYSNIVITYYPDCISSKQYKSPGTIEEMRHADRLGHPVIMIHEKAEEDENHPFGLKTTLGFANAERFFEALQDLDNPKFKLDARQKRVLRMLLENGNPKYQNIMNLIRTESNQRELFPRTN